MTCRIERLVSGDGCVVLRVSGRIQAKHVDMLGGLLGREKGKVAIDLQDVILVAREAVEFLALSDAGIELRNCPSYIREWVDRERTRAGAELSDIEIGTRDHVEDV